MKRYAFYVHILMLLCAFQLTAKRTTRPQAAVYIPALNEIVMQSGEIINAQSSQSRVEAKKNLVSLIKEKQLDKKTRAKIAYAISVILRTTPQTMQLSQEAYSFLMALLEVQEAQNKVLAVAQQIQAAVVFASAEERQRVVDAALRQLEFVTQQARATVDNARARINNMMKLSEMAFEGDISHLKNIVEKAGEIIIATDEKVRSKAQQEFTALIKRLDKNIKDAIMPDLEVIQNSTNETMQQSQEAYDRLLTMTQIIDEEMTDMMIILEKEKASAESEPVSSFARIRNFVANQLPAVENFFQKAFYTGMGMMPLNYLEKQSWLGGRMRILFDILSKPQYKDLWTSAQSELQGLVQREDLDDSIKKAFNPFMEKINNKQPLTEADRMIVRHFVISSVAEQLWILESIYGEAAEIVASYLLGSSTDNSTKQNYITTQMNEGKLYQKIKDQIRPDVEIILNTTHDTVEKSQRALAHLGQIINEQRSYMNRAERMINDQTSKLLGLVPESILKFVKDYPIMTSGIVGGILVYITREKVMKPYKNFIYNYKLLLDESYYFNGILRDLQKAAKEGDANKMHILMGILEGLGLEFGEEWETTKKRIRPKE